MNNCGWASPTPILERKRFIMEFNSSQNIVLAKSKDFALRIIKLYNHLTKNKSEYIISKQIFRSGTSIGANIANRFMRKAMMTLSASYQ